MPMIIDDPSIPLSALKPPVAPGTPATTPAKPARTTAATSGRRRATGGGSSGSAITAAQRTAAGNLNTLGKFNADSTKEQLARALANFDLADRQNRASAEIQRKQGSRKGAADRFAQARRFQQTTQGLLGAAGNSMQGSGLWSILDMLRARSDTDSGEFFSTLAQNRDAIQNALDEALSANVLARNEAASTAEFGLRGIEADTAAQLNNINPKLFKTPGLGGVTYGSKNYAASKSSPAHKATLAGYLTPASQASRRPGAQPASGSSYFDSLLSGYNRR